MKTCARKWYRNPQDVMCSNLSEVTCDFWNMCVSLKKTSVFDETTRTKQHVTFLKSFLDIFLKMCAIIILLPSLFFDEVLKCLALCNSTGTETSPFVQPQCLQLFFNLFDSSVHRRWALIFVGLEFFFGQDNMKGRDIFDQVMALTTMRLFQVWSPATLD